MRSEHIRLHEGFALIIMIMIIIGIVKFDRCALQSRLEVNVSAQSNDATRVELITYFRCKRACCCALLNCDSFIRVQFCLFVCLLFMCGTHVFPLNGIKKQLT